MIEEFRKKILESKGFLSRDSIKIKGFILFGVLSSISECFSYEEGIEKYDEIEMDDFGNVYLKARCYRTSVLLKIENGDEEYFIAIMREGEKEKKEKVKIISFNKLESIINNHDFYE